MSTPNIKRKINRLKKKLKEYDDQYYNHSVSVISDQEYDKLVRALSNYETKYPEFSSPSSTTKKVSSDRDTFFEKSKHKYQMYSLDNAYTDEELETFFNRLPDITFCLEDKVDGLSLELQYNKGHLVKAITRGDGLSGDNVTENVIQGIKNIPHYLNNDITCSVKGEVYMEVETFNKINSVLKVKGLKTYANPRNLASGTLKLHDPAKVKARDLKFIAWDVESPLKYKVGQRSQIDKLKWCIKAGFSIPEYDYTKSKEIKKVLGFFVERRSRLPYEVDGVVIKINDWAQREKIGYGTKSPKWAIAYKFNSEEATTILKSITFNVGRSGAVTPIANLEPVYLSGSTVKKATLHNADFIKEKGLAIGGEVRITKGGDIIPKVVGVVDNFGNKPFKFPEECPICGSTLNKRDGVDWYCPDSFNKCTQFKEKLYHLVSKEALDMQGFGEGLINKFIEAGLINNLIDIFTIKQADIMLLPGMGTKSATRVITSIDSAFSKPMDRWLFGLGIPGIGSINAKVLCEHFPTWNKLFRSTYESLEGIPGFAETMIGKVQDWVLDPANKRLVKELKKLGMPKRFEKPAPIIKEDILKGKTICITGGFGQYKRNDLSKKIEELGGIFTNSINAKTDILLVGTKVGKNKLEKASKHDIEILSIDESIKLLKLL